MRRFGDTFFIALQDSMDVFGVGLLLSLALISCIGSAAAGQVTSIDTTGSKLLIHVSKSGVFSGFADNHEVEAQIYEGNVDAKDGRLKLSVDSRQMKVLDPQLSPDKRRQVQERMLGPEVLDSSRYPHIVFESSKVNRNQDGSVQVDGQLVLHGVTKPISILAREIGGRYVGSFVLKQRDFGITPVRIAGGTVKVKDELKIEFEIQTSSGGIAK